MEEGEARHRPSSSPTPRSDAAGDATLPQQAYNVGPARASGPPRSARRRRRKPSASRRTRAPVISGRRPWSMIVYSTSTMVWSLVPRPERVAAETGRAAPRRARPRRGGRTRPLPRPIQAATPPATRSVGMATSADAGGEREHHQAHQERGDDPEPDRPARDRDDALLTAVVLDETDHALLPFLFFAPSDLHPLIS